MSGYRILAAGLMLLPSIAIAQDKPAVDQQQQILQLLQGMNTKFDTIEQRLDKIESKPADAPAAPTPPPAPQPAVTAAPVVEPEKTSAPEVAAVPAGVVTPGWKIDVFPYGKDGPTEAPIARTQAAIGKTYFNMHLQGGPVSSFVNYRGTAFFWAREAGTYSFNIYLDQSSGFNSVCDFDLKVEDLAVLGSNGVDQPFSKSGNIELQEGKYLLTTNVGCYQSGYSKDSAMRDSILRDYQRINYQVSVLGPSDGQMRPFEPEELFFIAPPKRMKPKMQQSLAPSVQPMQYQEQAPPQLEDPTEDIRPIDISRRGITTNNANLRAAPSTGADVVMQVSTRASLLVMQQVGDWYRVRTASGTTGFLHASLVAIME